VDLRASPGRCGRWPIDNFYRSVVLSTGNGDKWLGGPSGIKGAEVSPYHVRGEGTLLRDAVRKLRRKNGETCGALGEFRSWRIIWEGGQLSAVRFSERRFE